MHINRTFFALLAIGSLAALLTGCSTIDASQGRGLGMNHEPILKAEPPVNRSPEADIADCKQFASTASSMTQSTAIGVVHGGLIGAGLAALTKGNAFEGTVTLIGAGVGALNGFLKAELLQRQEVRRCMDGKGYSL